MSLNTALFPNEFGESPLSLAPEVHLPNGQSAVPQQFLSYSRTKTNVENIISKIKFSDHYPLFVIEKEKALYLQVGILGSENYSCSSYKHKIVYGRLWHIDSFAPTSEVIQTAFLALQKAREHELREHLVFKIHQGKHRATPFNTHIDLPLMAKHPELFLSESQYWTELKYAKRDINQWLSRLQLSQMKLSLIDIIQTKTGRWIVEIKCSESSKPETLFTEFQNQVLVITLEQGNLDEFLHQLMATLIHHSQRYVEEHFSFDGFNRFSHSHSPEAIAQFSLNTRLIKNPKPDFQHQYRQFCYSVDSQRVPTLACNRTKLGEYQRSILGALADLEGFSPTESVFPDKMPQAQNVLA